jgi:hypothetical protein
LNRGPLVPQTVRAVGRGVRPRGAKWLLCSEFVSAARDFAAFLHELLFGRLCPERVREDCRSLAHNWPAFVSFPVGGNTLERDLDLAARETLLDHLERRRGGLEQAQWNAPALTVAAQAFLLPVLTNRGIDHWARLVILLAGVAAVVAALLSLLRLRSREPLFSEAFAHYSKGVIPDIRAISPEMQAIERPKRSGPRWLQRLRPPYVAWSVALLLFAAADLVAYSLTV